MHSSMPFWSLLSIPFPKYNCINHHLPMVQFLDIVFCWWCMTSFIKIVTIKKKKKRREKKRKKKELVWWACALEHQRVDIGSPSRCLDVAWIRHGHGIDMAGTRVKQHWYGENTDEMLYLFEVSVHHSSRHAHDVLNDFWTWCQFYYLFGTYFFFFWYKLIVFFMRR